MDFHQLQALGGIVSPVLVKKEIEFTCHLPKPAESWADPEVPEVEDEAVTQRATVFIRKRTSRDFLDIMEASDDDRAFLSLFRCVCNEDGTPFFPSVDDAARLAEWMFLPLIGAVTEVNSFRPKKNPPKTTSGSTSPAPSADEASPNGRPRSPKKSARKS